MPSDGPTYKLPKPFVDTMRAALDVVAWDQASQPVRVTLPDGGVVMLEVIKDRGIVVRPFKAGDANRIRKFSDALAAADPVKYPKPTQDDIALVLARRNPPPDQQD